MVESAADVEGQAVLQGRFGGQDRPPHVQPGEAGHLGHKGQLQGFDLRAG